MGRLPQVPCRKPHISEWPRTNIFPGSSVGKESTWNTGDPGSTPGSGRSTGERISHPFQYSWATLVAQLIKNLPAMGETWVLLTQSLSRGSIIGRAAVMRRLVQGWTVGKSVPAVFRWPQFLATCLFTGTLSLLLDMATPSKRWSKSEQGGSHYAIYELVSDFRHHQSYHSLFTKCESLSPPLPFTFKGREMSFTFWREDCQRICGHV